MYARNIKVKLRANSVSEFRRLLRQRVIPLLRTQKGFRDEITLISPQGNEAIAISFWDHEDNAAAYNHVAYLDVLRVLSKVIESVPVVETFVVAGSTLHERPVTGA